MKSNKFDYLNICQVALARDLPIIKENIKEFNKYYNNLNFFIVCPFKELKLFSQIKENNIKIIDENLIISFSDFSKIFLKNLKNSSYFFEIQPRIGWYYQQVIKISFVVDFVKENKQNMVIWDADTIILKKINFFEKNFSVKYATINEFFRAYYLTNKTIFSYLPNFFLSSLLQFASLGKLENEFLLKNLNTFISKKNCSTGEWISNIISSAIFKTHKNYNGSMFSEYELIGMSNIFLTNTFQKIIPTLRNNLNGKLTNLQKHIARFIGFYHVTYEHSHPNKNSFGMLSRKQSWVLFFKIVVKYLAKFLPYLLFYRILRFFYYLKIKHDKIKYIYK
jgi:hypothetical protein